MKKENKISGAKWYRVMLIAVMGLSIAACSDNSSNYKLGPLPTASFTATPLASNPNKVVVKSTTNGAFMWSWDFGNGTSSKSEADTVTYIYKGTYTIKLTVFSQGGSASTTKDVTMATNYQGVNLLANNGDLNSTDWTVLNTGGNQTSITFSNGTANFSNTGDSNGGIYQAVQVESGAKYMFSATVKGAGATNSWFEVYIGTTVPTQGSDYSDSKYVSLNTWAGCGINAFDGDLATIGCSGDGTGAGGIITFATTGTYYLVIKSGSSGGTLGNGGITLENISLSKL
ncbi:MAG TPA: PKD domain-containing protein [Balneolales bacterium]|nr:PKD domain-containing protein [Balneolales bacterium]